MVARLAKKLEFKESETAEVLGWCQRKTPMAECAF